MKICINKQTIKNDMITLECAFTTKANQTYFLIIEHTHGNSYISFREPPTNITLEEMDYLIQHISHLKDICCYLQEYNMQLYNYSNSTGEEL